MAVLLWCPNHQPQSQTWHGSTCTKDWNKALHLLYNNSISFQIKHYAFNNIHIQNKNTWTTDKMTNSFAHFLIQLTVLTNYCPNWDLHLNNKQWTLDGLFITKEKNSNWFLRPCVKFLKWNFMEQLNVCVYMYILLLLLCHNRHSSPH